MSQKQKTEVNFLNNVDLYKLLEVKEQAHIKEIKKAYRKKALKLHPDKNPDNPKAAELFHQLSEALKILSDVGARAAYDHVRQAKKAAAGRTAKLDEGRKKVKLDLEAREHAAEETQFEKKKMNTTLEQEINRLREEGSRILQEEQAALKKLLKQEKEKVQPARLKVKWSIAKQELNNDGYDEEMLYKIFSKYGKVLTLVISQRNRGTAIVEFDNINSADLAYLSEAGIPSMPLTVSWLAGRPTCFRVDNKTQDDAAEFNSKKNLCEVASDCDFEVQVMRRMREAQERKNALEKANQLQN